MDGALEIVALIFAALFAGTAIYNVATALVASGFRTPVSVVSIGLGPVLLRIPIGQTQLHLSPLPFAGFVRFRDALEEDLDRTLQPTGEARTLFEKQPPLVKAIIALTGPLGTIIAAWGVMGGAAFDEMLRTFPQVWAMLQAYDQPLDIVTPLANAVATHGHLFAAGLVLTKFAAFNLLPLPPILSGGLALLYILDSVFGPGFSRSVGKALTIPALGTLIVLFGICATRLALAALA